MEVDLEAELMDLATNEREYLPLRVRPSAADEGAGLAQRVEAQLLAQAVSQLSLRMEQQRERENENARKARDVVSEELLSAEQQALAAEEDARLERRNLITQQLVVERRQQIARRLEELIPQLQEATDRASVLQPSQDEAEERRMVNQMTAKVEFVVNQSARELERTLCSQKQQQQTMEGAAVGWTRLLELLPAQERDYLSRAADEHFVEQLKYLHGEREHERDDVIQQHLHAVLVLQAPQYHGQQVGKLAVHHSLRHLQQSFQNAFRECYASFLQFGGQGNGRRSGVALESVVCVLPLASADVAQFAAILSQVALYKYPFLQASERQRRAVRRGVLAALFEVLQPILHGLFVAAFQREDAVLQNLAQVAQGNSLAFFQVSPRFRLDGSWPDELVGELESQEDANDDGESLGRSLRAFGGAIHYMNNLASDRSPWAKLERLARVCQEIDQAIKAFYDRQPVERQPSNEEINVTADDLCALLSFVLAAAPSAQLHVFTQLCLLGSFLPAELAAGPEGFALATFSAAVRHLMSLR